MYMALLLIRLTVPRVDSCQVRHVMGEVLDMEFTGTRPTRTMHDGRHLPV